VWAGVKSSKAGPRCQKSRHGRSCWLGLPRCVCFVPVPRHQPRRVLLPFEPAAKLPWAGVLPGLAGCVGSGRPSCWAGAQPGPPGFPQPWGEAAGRCLLGSVTPLQAERAPQINGLPKSEKEKKKLKKNLKHHIKMPLHI